MPEIMFTLILIWSLVGGLVYINTQGSLKNRGKNPDKRPLLKKIVLLVVSGPVVVLLVAFNKLMSWLEK